MASYRSRSLAVTSVPQFGAQSTFPLFLQVKVNSSIIFQIWQQVLIMQNMGKLAKSRAWVLKYIFKQIFHILAQFAAYTLLYVVIIAAQFSSVTQSCLTIYDSMSFTSSPSLLKFTSIESMMPSNHLNLCHLLLFLPSIFPASGSFPMTQFCESGGQSIGASTSVSVLPWNIQDWFPLRWADSISLQSKGLARVFSNTTVHTTVQKHQFFTTLLSSWSNSHIHTWLLEKP